MIKFATVFVLFFVKVFIAVIESIIKLGAALRLDIPIITIIAGHIVIRVLDTYFESEKSKYDDVQNPWNIAAIDAINSVYSAFPKIRRIETHWDEKNFLYFRARSFFVFGCARESKKIKDITTVVHEGMHHAHSSMHPYLSSIFSLHAYRYYSLLIASAFLILAIFLKSRTFLTACFAFCCIAAFKSVTDLIREIHANYRTIKFLEAMPVFELPKNDSVEMTQEAKDLAEKRKAERAEAAMQVVKLTAVTGGITYLTPLICSSILILWFYWIFIIFK